MWLIAEQECHLNLLPLDQIISVSLRPSFMSNGGWFSMAINFSLIGQSWVKKSHDYYCENVVFYLCISLKSNL